jgi:hypothetical protein
MFHHYKTHSKTQPNLPFPNVLLSSGEVLDQLRHRHPAPSNFQTKKFGESAFEESIQSVHLHTAFFTRKLGAFHKLETLLWVPVLNKHYACNNSENA